MTDNDYFTYSFGSPSAEFLNLCQFQLDFWSKTQKADWSAVYLTQGTLSTRNPSLLPVAVYPASAEEKFRSKLLTQESSRITQNTEKELILEDLEESAAYQVVLPLMYQDKVLGLLVTRRKGEQWQQEEIGEGEKIAHSLAIALLLDQRQLFYQQQLQHQQQRQQWEETQLDNLLHQLRNPLTAIRTFSKLLLKRLGNDQKSQSAVEGVVRESDRLQDLLKTFEKDWKASNLETSPSLKALSSSSPPLLPSATLSLESVDLREILRPLLLSAQAIAQEKEIELAADLSEFPIIIQGNCQALREVFTNLLDNAVKYTPKGGRIEVGRLAEQENYQGIAIADTGYGIPLEDIPYIFERNYRGVQETGSIPGTGLGLSIVKNFIEEMHGKIDVISPNGLTQPEGGTTFQVWFLNSTMNKE